MTPERWHRINALFHEALDRPVQERAAFLANACGGDESLRGEVESLIETDEQAGAFIEEPAFTSGVEMTTETRTLAKGQFVGPYEILSFLGAGGMGEVYLAQDTRLGRKVAIKFLSPHLMADRQAAKRLIREARAAAKLDHPSICTIYEIGTHSNNSYIVMQYIEGETLAQRVQRGQLEPPEALSVAFQVADALSEAHSQGIIHRDIKPQNIIISPRGRVKVLDFGLAKLMTQDTVSGRLGSVESTLSTPGLVIGTVPYMSPEQIKGDLIDPRTDIFSFGTLLYEMICGLHPFTSSNAVATAAAILTAETAPITRYCSHAPFGLQRIISKCLQKDKERRYQTIVDLLLEIGNVQNEVARQLRYPIRELSPESREDNSVRPTSPLGRYEIDEIEPLDYLEAEIRKVDQALGAAFLPNESPSILVHMVIDLVDLIAIAMSCSPFLACIRIADGSFAVPQTQFVTVAVVALISFFYFALTQSGCSRTFGMMLTNTRVVDGVTFKEISASRALIRTAGYFIAVVPAMLGIIWRAFNSNHRAWQDFLSGTIVVRDY